MKTQGKFILKCITAQFVLVMLILLLGTSACGILPLAGKATETPQPTATSTVTETPQPTATLTSTPTATATITATATATPDRTGTAVAKATSEVNDFLASIKPDLDEYGLTLDSGHLAWQNSEKFPIELDSYGQTIYTELEGLGPVGDFLFQSDIKWDSSSGLAGCGFLFRSDQDIQKGEQYQFAMLRLQAAPAWDIEYHNYGEWQYTITLDGKLQFDKVIHDEKNSTNKVAILAKGSDYTVFINGKQMRTLNNNKLSKGLAAIFGWQESGKTTCEFSNSWLWSFDE